ncbi:MAG TPA: hypothetical protein VMZ29_17335 [Candidatus Bathyarchaeia archaeon]|nr:hypothetical protein [Candidatus Bathyarchaeia archaeon]
MKCCYDPELDSEGNCINCNVPLCKTCYTNAQLNEGLCQACLRQKRFLRIYGFYRIAICGLGIGWMVLSFFIFPNEGGGFFGPGLTYGILGLLAAFAINMITLVLMSRALLSNLKPQQKVFVALARYSVSGNKVFFNQAIKAMKKVPDMTPYRDALFDQIVSILILQPHDLPTDWIEYVSEKFLLSEEELLSGILEFGQDVFDDNIFQYHYYQAIEPLIEIYKRTNRKDLYNQLIDRLIQRLNSIDLKAATKPSPVNFPGMPQQQQQPEKESASVLQDKAFLTELKLIDFELEEFLTKAKRKKDWEKINEIIEQFELPKVPKNTFDAARTMVSQQQKRPEGPDGIPGTIDDVKDSKYKICAECSQSFPKEQLSSYVYKNIKVNVCSECSIKLEQDGHRAPRLLASITKHDEEEDE